MWVRAVDELIGVRLRRESRGTAGVGILGTDHETDACPRTPAGAVVTHASHRRLGVPGPIRGPVRMPPRPPCPAFGRRCSWLDQASARRALAVPPRGTN